MNINENIKKKKNNVKIIGEKKRKSLLRFTHKISHILAAMYPRPMNMVPN